MDHGEISRTVKKRFPPRKSLNKWKIISWMISFNLNENLEFERSRSSVNFQSQLLSTFFLCAHLKFKWSRHFILGTFFSLFSFSFHSSPMWIMLTRESYLNFTDLRYLPGMENVIDDGKLKRKILIFSSNKKWKMSIFNFYDFFPSLSCLHRHY